MARVFSAHVVIVSVLMPMCLSCQQGNCGDVVMGSSHPRGAGETLPPRVASAGDEGCAEGEAEDGVCLEPGLLQKSALLSPAGSAGPLGGGSQAARSPFAALGLHASLLLGGERGRHLAGAGSGTIIILIVVIPVVLLCVLFAWARATPEPALGPSGRYADAAKNPMQQQAVPGGRHPATGSSSRSPGRTQGRFPAADPRAQPSPPHSSSPTPSVHALSPAAPPPGPGRTTSPPVPPAGPQSGRAAAAQPPAPAPPAAAQPPATAPSSGAAEGSIPILCRSLVLPNLESCFNISMDTLSGRRFGDVSIKGASARSLLNATVGEHELTLRSVGSDTKPRVTIAREGRQLKIYGRDQKLFGTLEPASGPNDFALVVGGEVKMKVLADPGPELQFRAFASDGRQVASAGSSGSDWTLQVKANVDAILIASCMMSMIFYGPSSKAGTPESTSRSPARP